MNSKIAEVIARQRQRLGLEPAPTLSPTLPEVVTSGDVVTEPLDTGGTASPDQPCHHIEVVTPDSRTAQIGDVERIRALRSLPPKLVRLPITRPLDAEDMAVLGMDQQTPGPLAPEQARGVFTLYDVTDVPIGQFTEYESCPEFIPSQTGRDQRERQVIRAMMVGFGLKMDPVVVEIRFMFHPNEYMDVSNDYRFSDTGITARSRA